MSTATIKLPKIIDEKAQFESIPLTGTTKVIIDCSAVGLINSLGIREFIVYVSKIPENAPIVFVNCTPPIVRNFNMVKNMLRSTAIVESFDVPYYCESCDAEHITKLQNGIDYQFRDKVPDLPDEKPCPKCGQPMEIVTVQSAYLKFFRK